MMVQPARLDTGHALSGQSIDRSRSGLFRLDGRSIPFFAGDTVLTALLASGVDCVGLHRGHPIALTPSHAPAIAPAGDPRHALPMARVPATDGADYRLVGENHIRTMRDRLLRRHRNSLHLDLDHPDALRRPWQAQTAEPGPATDIAIVGGGLAGMASALEGARNGLRVTLIEALPRLGGHAMLFGTQDGEEAPAESVARLSAAVAENDAITVLTQAEVFAIRPGLLRLHQVMAGEHGPRGRVLDIAARNIVLATGSVERLPVFAGNRQPGVIGAQAAFELAHHHGIWPGRSAVIATTSSPAYRLAMLAQDAGITVTRMLDSRPQPQSRFIEFSKAYGITLAGGTAIGSATPARSGFTVQPRLVMANVPHAEETLGAERVIACGGWQPDLALWHEAGGHSHWNEARARLEPSEGPQGIVLAGSAAGWLTLTTAIESGRASISRLLDRPGQPIEEQTIDPIYESPDAPTTVDVADGSAIPAYLESGQTGPIRPATKTARGFWNRTASADWSLVDMAQDLDTASIAALVQRGTIPAAQAGNVAAERVGSIGLGDGAEEEQVEAPVPLIPIWLQGRYPGAKLWLVSAEDSRALPEGGLLYGDAKEADPLKSIGVVLRQAETGAVALITGAKDQPTHLRMGGHAVPLRRLRQWREG